MFTGIMPLEHVRAILEKDSTWIKQDLTKALPSIRSTEVSEKDPAFALAINIGGFFPSPPPKWPTAVVYSLMDTILANAHILDIENPGNNFSRIFDSCCNDAGQQDSSRYRHHSIW